MIVMSTSGLHFAVATFMDYCSNHYMALLQLPASHIYI